MAPKLLVLTLFLSHSLLAADIIVQNEAGGTVPVTMITESLATPPEPDISDNGYQTSGKPILIIPDITQFSGANGKVKFPPRDGKMKYRFKKFGFKDHLIHIDDNNKSNKIILKAETDPIKLAEQKPANMWLGALEVGTAEDKIIFKMQCGFCHQQGTEFTRRERTPEDWEELIKRMIRYGSRLPTDLQKSLPSILAKNYEKLRKNPNLLAPYRPLPDSLSKVTIKEWAIGDSMSQTHDMLVAHSGLVYVADNIQDRLYEVDPKTNHVTVYKIPHREGDNPGGLIAPRLKEFPRHDSTSNAHSLAESQVDHHIFITPSAQRRLVEFDPHKKEFILHEMDEGFYPHTIRVDQKDNVWFTLALSNQVAKFDRKSKTFQYFDLPARSFKEKIISKNIGLIFKLMSWGIPLSNWLKIDRESNGVPLAYGIDITPDGKVWVARLHARDIGRIDPETNEIKMIPTPFWGPRRMRADADGNLWITSFGESKIARYSPSLDKFDMFDLPVNPIGSDTPYSLNVDKERKKVWVTGNQSNSVYVFDIENSSWKNIPLPKTTTFTRDFEFAKDGTAYTANSNFPSWHIEDGQPTLIEIKIKE